MTRYEVFDRSRIRLADLEDRGHDLVWTHCLPLQPPAEPYQHPQWTELVRAIHTARHQGRPVIVMMGAHPIKLGLSRYLIDLIERRIITHLATNGAGLIHDFELASFGGTSEDVARWIRAGQFGLWRQTGLFDLVGLPPDYSHGPPDKTDPRYYFRPWKTTLARTVADGGTSYYFCADHRQTIPTLWQALISCKADPRGAA